MAWVAVWDVFTSIIESSSDGTSRGLWIEKKNILERPQIKVTEEKLTLPLIGTATEHIAASSET